jgi:GDSL-like Lipase/Acylhydrolase family
VNGSGNGWAAPVVTLALMTVGLVAACETASATPGPGASALPRQPGCAAAATVDSLCILVLGDSIAEGTPLTGDDRWWPRMRGLLASALPARTVAVDSWAVPGSQVAVLESAVRDQPDVGSYDLAIVIEGVNDAHILAVGDWEPRYEAAVLALENRGMTVIVTAPPPSFENGAFGTRYDGIAAAVRDVASRESRGRSLLDLAVRWRADGPTVAAAYYVDSIHQALPGQIVMATLARDVVLQALGAR